MKRDYSLEMTPEMREKSKKNLVYVGIFSVVMLFAGLTSAYIVSMGDSFWLKYPMPTPFWISTALIVISSICLELAIRFARKGDLTKLKLFITLTLLTGIGFVYFQMKGYGKLVDNGIYAVNNHIIVTEGRYGDYFEVKYDDKFIEVDGNNFSVAGKLLSETQMNEFKAFMSQFLDVTREKQLSVKNYGGKFVLYFNNQLLGLKNNRLISPEGKELEYVDESRLRDLAMNIKDGRGDFFVQGQIGKDFHIYFKGKELEYKDRDLQYNGKKLSKYLQIKAMETSDTASSYLYIITFLHLLHIAITLFYMLRMTIGSFSGRFNAENYLSLRLGAIFWHFLGLLWFYLLFFLLFIH